MRKSGVALAVGLVLGFVASVYASRNASGTYSLPSGNPVVSGTTITASWANNTLNDIKSELTDSLSRSGKGAMLAALQSYVGTVSAPGLTFSGDTDTGLYRIGANNVGLSCGGTKVIDASATTVTFPLGITVTQSTANATGIVTTGNGTGYGLSATGGSSNGDAIRGTGIGSGYGVVGTAGTTGVGIRGFGGSTSGVGIHGTATSGSAVYGQTNAGIGGEFFGGGSSSGVEATGGATGKGIIGVGGGTAVGGQFSNGTAATSGTRRDAVALTNGDVDMSGVADPTAAATVAADRLTPKSFAKAWGKIRVTTAGVVSVRDGLNISGTPVCSDATDDVIVTLTTAMSSGDYAVVADSNYATVYVNAYATANNTIRIMVTTMAGAGANPCSLAGDIDLSFIAIGAQ